MSGIYIHIPFCKQACSYCDFYFVTRDRMIPAFVDALVHEISVVPVSGGSPFPGDPVRTLYFGGGTPSRLPATQTRRIFEALHQRFDLSGLTEFTVEVNPEDVTRELLSGLRDLGVTRLSMGIQSFQPDLLEFMHRAHSAQQAHRALEQVAAAGFSSYSVDLIYGCPGQTREQLLDDLDKLLAYHPPHVSAYSLTIEPRTRLGKQAALGRLEPADDESVAAQARLIRETLASHDIHRYEISNYASPGEEAEHNSAYWSHENYLGLGPSSHTFFWPGGGRKRDREGEGEGTGIGEGEWKRVQEPISLAVRWHHPHDIHTYGQLVQSDGYRVWVDAVLGAPPKNRHGSMDASQNNGPDTTMDASQTALPDAPHPGLPEGTSSPGGIVPPDGLQSEWLSLKTLAGERLMTGLRTSAGVDPKEFHARYGHALSTSQAKHVAEFRRRGLMVPDDPLRLTEAGFELADAIILRLFD